MYRPKKKPAQGASRDEGGGGSRVRPAARKNPRIRGVAESAEASIKLQKRLADAGFGSRRAMEELIAAGEVSVNGRLARIGMRVSERDRISVRGEPIAARPARRAAGLPRIVLYHKPEGEIVSRHDPEGRPSVFDRAGFLRRGRWLSIGRLDFNTCGLLVFTDFGELANRLSHPRYQVRRDYAVRVLGALTPEQVQRLRSGVQLEDGEARFELLEAQGGEGSNRWYRVRVREGRNRLVRRMFAAVGLQVSRLMRTAFGPFELPPRLKRGQWLRLEDADVRRAMSELEPDAPGKRSVTPSATKMRSRPRPAGAAPGKAETRHHRPRSSRSR